MCGRYVSPEEAEIERFWHIGRPNNNPFGRRFNVAPTLIIPILRLDRATGEIELVNARWGLIPAWWKGPKPPRTTHNDRFEQALSQCGPGLLLLQRLSRRGDYQIALVFAMQVGTPLTVSPIQASAPVAALNV
jgi:SOS response associated peptidase (SRAP)